MCRPRALRIPLVLLLLAVLAEVPATTQTGSGVIEGRVMDSMGAALPGVTVTITSREFGLQRTVVADEKGNYTVPGLPPGSYEVRATLAGFVGSVQAVALAAGQKARLDFTLSIATITETVQVTASAPVVNARASAFATSAAHWRPWPGMVSRTTTFDRIEENRFVRVADSPRSTFSTDVDTASYAYMRRSLVRGVVPPRDSVRTEELLNYFRYDYPNPTGSVPLSVTTEVARCPWEPRHALLHVGVQARQSAEPGSIRRNLVFLLDVSGSMQPEDKLPLVRSAMSLLVNQLTARDTVAIVVYAGSSGLALPITPGDEHGVILEAIRRLHAGGSTNGGEGIELAYKLAREAFIDGGVNRVILATDGDFNVGVTDRSDLLEMIEQKRKSGIYLSVLGVGDDNLQDGMMEQLADRGNGNYAYLDTLEEAQKVLVREADATLIPVATDVKIQVEFNPRHVQAYRLIGYENRLLAAEDFKDDQKDAGDVGAGQSVTALYEIVPANLPHRLPEVDPLRYQQVREMRSATQGEMAQVKLRYKRPGASRSEPLDVVVSMPSKLEAPVGTNLGFSAAVATFGMMLRDSKNKGEATWKMAAELARRHRGPDADGYRAQFVRLVEMAEGISATKRGSGDK